MPKTVLIIDEVHESLIEGLKGHGFEVIYEPKIRVSDVLSISQEKKVSGLVVRSKMSFSKEFLQAAIHLKWIARAGVGTDNIDMGAAAAQGIEVVTADGANAITVAEHVLGMILSTLHKLHMANDHVKSGAWDREAYRGSELSSRVVGIIGMGNTGTALARLLQSFGVEIFAYDKYKSDFGNQYIRECKSAEEVYAAADVLSFHVPLTEETRGMIGEHMLGVVEKNQTYPIIVNASRGEVMDPISIESALQSGIISNLLLDVWMEEPPLKHGAVFKDVFLRLVQKNNVMFSPHVGGWSVESYRRISEKLLSNILNLKDTTH